MLAHGLTPVVSTKAPGDFKTNLAALGKAIDLILKAAGGSSLQSNIRAVVRSWTITMDLSGADRDIMSSFLLEFQGR